MNWTRAYLRPSVVASACASVDLPTPGMSSISRWPRARRHANASRSGSRLPTTMRSSCASTRGEPLGDGNVGLAERANGHGVLFRERVPLPGTLTCNLETGHPWRARATLHPSERRRRSASARHRSPLPCRCTGHKANVVPTAYITHPSFLLHDMGPYHPECPDRLRAIGDRLIGSGLDSYLVHHSAPAADDDAIALVHGRSLHRDDRGREPGVGPALPRSRHRDERAFADGRPACGGRRRARHRPRRARRMPHGVLRGPPARPPCRARPRDGLLPLQQRRGRRGARARRSTGSSAWRSSISTSITATAPRTSSRAIRGC